MSGFAGVLLGVGSNYALDAQAIAASDVEAAPTDATATVTISGGVVDCVELGTDFTLVTFGDSADLEIFITTVSGTVDVGTVDAWTALDGLWSLTRSGGAGDTVFTGTYAVRIAATGQVLVSGVAFSLTATVV